MSRGGTSRVSEPDVNGVFNSQGNNLIGDAGDSSGWVGSDRTGTSAKPLNAGLAPLGDYGGPTQTMPPLYGSPAIGAGNINLVPAGITTDQRGEPRFFQGKVDIGAYQLQVVIVPSFVVDTTADFSDPSDGKTSLREAIASANALPGHTITWDKTVFATAQTITLTGAQLELSGASGTETIMAPVADLTISGGGLSRVFQIDPGVTASLAGLTITSGRNLGSGGGLYDLGTTTLTNCAVSGNFAHDGAGVDTVGGGTTTLTNCTISGNMTFGTGGGGGLANNVGTTTLTNCTVSGNSAFQGGGLTNNVGTTTLTNCTVSGNSAGSGGGLYDKNGTITLTNTIVVVNTSSGSGPDVDGVFTSQGNNLIGETDASSGWVSSDRTGTSAKPLNAGLAPLGDYGGPTQTMPPLYGSPAIGAGNINLVPAGTTTDQRGQPRFFHGKVDIGAYELQVVIDPSFVVDTTADFSDPSDGKTSLREAIASANAVPGHTIIWDKTIFASAQTITLTGAQLELSDTSAMETITAPAEGLTISGGGLSRVFQVDPGVTASLAGLTITRGKTYVNGGGGLYVLGTTALTNCTVSGNSSGSSTSYFGGEPGGGLFIGNGGTATLTNCTVSGNSTGLKRNGNGGGVFNSGGTATLTNCTVSGNSTVNGGGVFNSGGTTTLTSCTVSGNSSGGNCGGLYNKNGATTVTNTIVAANFAGSSGPDVSGVFTSQGNNLVGETDGSSGWISSDETGTLAHPLNAELAPLGDYGGPTQTMPALYGSPAIGAGNISLVPAGITTDQRGEPRFFQGKIDIGAYQLQVVIVPSFVVDTTADFSDPSDGKTSLREAIASANAVPGHTITWDKTIFASAKTITLTGAQLELSGMSAMETITAPAAGLTISAGGLSRVFQVDPGITASLAGLTITRGKTYVNGGGGLYVLGTTTLTKCTVSGNSAFIGGESGGGLFIGSGGTATLIKCTIGGNSAAHTGGGLASIGGTATLTNCTISGNSAGLSGGGLYLSRGTTSLTNCTISGNSADGGGGGLRNFYGTITLTNCTVTGNSGGIGGGVESVGRGTATLTNCTVSGNSGGGVSNFYYGTITLTDCTVSGNSGGGVFNFYGTITLTNCAVTGNSGRSNGDGLYNKKGTATLTNCTVSGNSTGSGNGGGLYNYAGTLALTRCTVSGNSAPKGNGGGMYTRGGYNYYGQAILGTSTLTNCTVSGNSAGGSGGGIVNSTLASTTVTGTTVKSNSAITGGGIANQGTLRVSSSIILNNQARGSTGGDGIGGGILSNGGSLTLTNCTLTRNMAIGGAGVPGAAGGDGIGGGLALENNSTATVTNTTFWSNVAQGGAGGFGANGGAGIGGGIAVAIGTVLGMPDTSSLTLSSSTLNYNVAQGERNGKGANGGSGWGGGIFVGAGGSALIQQSSIAGNQAIGGRTGTYGDGDGIGGGLYVATGASVRLKKSSVWANYTNTSNRDIYGKVTWL
jgi:CSLREA domain-containing protein